jgi:5-methylcytosine-specific restriction endonuclease McrA
MRAGAAQRAEKRLFEDRQAKEKVRRRGTSLHAAQIRRAAKISEKTKILLPPPNYNREQLILFIEQAMDQPCPYSGVILDAKNFEVDHKIPLDRGGQFTLENSEVITGSSNSQKGSLTDIEFHMLMDLLAGFPKEAKRDVLKRLGTGGRMFR